jgi:hypothetical protein
MVSKTTTNIQQSKMKIHDIITEGFFTGQQKSKVDDVFMQAFWAWQQNGSVESVEQAAQIILTSPLSKPYQTPPAGIQTIYRTVGDINRSPTARNRVAVAYSPKLSGAEYYFRNLASGNKNFHVVQKKFNPEDFLLDFAAMVKGLRLQNKQYEKEYEIWMRPTQYYASYNADELVDRRGLIQKMRGVQHPTQQAQQTAAQIRAQQEKELDELL